MYIYIYTHTHIYIYIYIYNPVQNIVMETNRPYTTMLDLNEFSEEF